MTDQGSFEPHNPPDWWTEMMYRSFEFMRQNELFTSEDIKLANLDFLPQHFNQWGHMAQCWVESAWCHKTSTTSKAKSKQARHRKLPVYRSLVFKDRK